MREQQLKDPVVILEVANSHGGDYAYLEQLITNYSAAQYSNLHIKFQPFKYDATALPDFQYFELYQNLFFEREKWAAAIKTSSQLFEGVWLDINDVFSISILQENIQHIYGIKLQASFLANEELYQLLSVQDLERIELIINISGYELDEITNILGKFKNLSFKKIILQMGFQSYPTLIENTSLNKITLIKENFSNHCLCFADHLDGQDEFSTILPLLAFAKGCNYLEKHICLERKTTKYDYYSALELTELQRFLDRLVKAQQSIGEVFISEAENKYLASTLQIPVLCTKLSKGQMVSPVNLIYRRTSQKGLTFTEIQALQSKGRILSVDKETYTTLELKDFVPSKVGVIVACRLKSTRLRKKAILPLHGVPAIQRCLANCMKFPYIDKVVLATSITDEDAELRNYIIDGVEFYQGEPDDVISRYINICNKYTIDVIYRITGDNPCPSYEIAKILMDSHFRSGADYTYTEDITVGITTEIYNLTTLKTIQEKVGKADYSEYMNWYVINNPSFFKINKVVLPQNLVRKDLRLTMDYPEDLHMFNKLFESLDQLNLPASAENIFNTIDRQEIAVLNQGISQHYHDPNLISELEIKTKFPDSTLSSLEG